MKLYKVTIEIEVKASNENESITQAISEINKDDNFRVTVKEVK